MAVNEFDLTPELCRFLTYARNPPRVRWNLLTVYEVARSWRAVRSGRGWGGA